MRTYLYYGLFCAHGMSYNIGYKIMRNRYDVNVQEKYGITDV